MLGKDGENAFAALTVGSQALRETVNVSRKNVRQMNESIG
jgi:hypothetical protein